MQEPENTPAPENVTAFEKYAEVYAQNSDLVGWVSISGTRIDYPIMQTKDNPNFYLKHAFDKSYSSYGVPYLQGNCDIRHFRQSGIVWPPHEQRQYCSPICASTRANDFIGRHKTICFDTLDHFGEYEVIAAFKTVAYSGRGSSITTLSRLKTPRLLRRILQSARRLALYDTGVTAEYGDKLLTLSTCEYSRTNGRLVVVAKLINE